MLGNRGRGVKWGCGKTLQWITNSFNPLSLRLGYVQFLKGWLSPETREQVNNDGNNIEVSGGSGCRSAFSNNSTIRSIAINEQSQWCNFLPLTIVFLLQIYIRRYFHQNSPVPTRLSPPLLSDHWDIVQQCVTFPPTNKKVSRIL